jgi:hypothetical protein
LLEQKAIRNPYLRENIENSKNLLYASWNKDLVKRYWIIN